ncbi:MAG: hypothetical protein ACRYGR_10595 [Janthinobacterium lividum]
MRVIPFPDQQQRRALRQQKFIRKKQNVLNKFNAFVKNFFFKIAYGLIVLLANVLHYATTIFFYVLYFFRKPILFVLCGMCIVAYFHLGRKFMTANDISIAVFLLIFVLVLSSERIADKIQTNMPFHRLFKCKIYIEPTEQNKTTKYILLEHLD